MGFRLNPIFITNQSAVSNEELLDKVGLTNLMKGKTVGFYDTNKEWDTVFLGTKGDCKILVDGDLCSGAFEEDSPLLGLLNCEIAAIIWNDTTGNYGFCLMRDGKVVRKVMVSDNEIEYDFGQPIQEEIEIIDDELFVFEEMEEILESIGQEGLEKIAKSERICRATNNIVRRYLGAGLVEIHEEIELNEFEEE